MGSPLKVKCRTFINLNYLTIPINVRLSITHIVPVDNTLVKLSKINNVLYNECSLGFFSLGNPITEKTTTLHLLINVVFNELDIPWNVIHS